MIRGIATLVIVGAIAALLLLGGVGYGGYTLITQLDATKTELATTTVQRTALADELVQERAANAQLADKLAAELAKNGEFAAQISDIASTVGTLTKLSQTDKELLQKYSRVYFLNENYVPSDLSEISAEYQLDPSRHLQFHTKAKPYLENMLADAKDAGVPLLVLSAYRSFGEQIVLKNSYKVTYGAGSNRFSADQGYSEHQLGTAVDLTTKEISGTSLSFGTSLAGKWLTENAYRYGFILSYPQSNTFYQYEPWHWRFVGVALATKLHDETIHFYDMPQRDIDEYLVTIFD